MPFWDAMLGSPIQKAVQAETARLNASYNRVIASYEQKIAEYRQIAESYKQQVLFLRQRENELRALSSMLSQQEFSLQEREKSLAVQQQRISDLVREKVVDTVSDIAHRSYLQQTPVFQALATGPDPRKLSSVLTRNMQIFPPFEASAMIRGESGQVYQTSLHSCSCPDFQARHQPCKHMYRLALELGCLLSFDSSLMKAEIGDLSLQLQDLRSTVADMEKTKDSLEKKVAKLNEQEEVLSSNLTAMPWMAGMMADYLTYDMEALANSLDYGANKQRDKKVATIREIRADAQRRIAEAKEAVYQLEYLKALYPGLEDILDTDFRELNFTGEIPDHDPTRDFLSKEEWASLSSAQKDQLALDRYVQSHQKTKWQIGRDYELSVAHEYIKDGYRVDTYGSRKGLEDLGRDLIATKPDRTVIIQCKYWSKEKTIHEKHLFQLYGTVVMYSIQNPMLTAPVSAVFVTNTSLSPIAREIAAALDITVVENHEMVDFPRIKCNIGKDESGAPTYIYHLPMDAQYDNTQINAPGEFYAFTVQEALDAGFRRAYKWHGI